MKKFRIFKRLVLLNAIFSLFLFGSRSIAADSPTGQTQSQEATDKNPSLNKNLYFGLQIGSPIPTLENDHTRIGYGAKFGYKFRGRYGVGLFANTSEKAVPDPYIDAFSRRYSFGGLELAYYFPEDGHGILPYADGLYVGVDMGAVLISLTGTTLDLAVSTLEMNFIYGPVIGYDYKLTPWFSIGAEMSALFVPARETSLGIETVYISEFQVYNFLLGFKFWI